MTARFRATSVAWLLVFSSVGCIQAKILPPSTPEPTVFQVMFITVKPTLPSSFATPAAVPSPLGQCVAGFDAKNGLTCMGGLIGIACPEAGCRSSNTLTVSYPDEPGRGRVARLEYHIDTWVAFWMKLHREDQDPYLDLTPYPRLTFDIRADPQPGRLTEIPQEMKIELHRPNPKNLELDCQDPKNVELTCREVSIYYLGEIGNTWQTKHINLEDLGATGFPGISPLSSRTQIDELVFTFESDSSHSGNDGVVYLDNIHFER